MNYSSSVGGSDLIKHQKGIQYGLVEFRDKKSIYFFLCGRLFLFKSETDSANQAIQTATQKIKC